MKLPQSHRGHRISGSFIVFAISLCALWLDTVPAQMDFLGYFESEVDQIQLIDRQYTFGYNKLRLDFESRAVDDVLITGNINVQKFHGKTTWDFFDFLPFDSVQISEDIITSLPVVISDTLYLDNIYLRATFPHLDLTVGRQPVSLGTGYAWNPLDIFNRKDLLDPTYEQPGVNAVRAEIPLADRAGLDLIIQPDSSFGSSTKMIQLKTGWGSFDFTMNYAQQYHLIPYWAFRNYNDMIPTHENLQLAGGSFVGQVGELGLWGEVIRSLNSNWKDFGELVLGADHTLDSGLYIMVEYFTNSLGANESELAFNHYLHYFSGETHSLMQDYLFVLSMFAFSNFVSGSVFLFGNLDDQSFSLVPQLQWNAFENVDISFLFSQSFGEKDTEFGIQDKALRLRLRAYF
ncbi:MAG: hypothetical protein ACE5EE_06835 [Fidelibacterota bacterium]